MRGERWLDEREGAARSRLRPHEKGHESDRYARPRRGVESEHHLVNSRVLFPSASAPIGLRGHGGRSSSSSYFNHSYMLRLERCSRGFSACT